MIKTLKVVAVAVAIACCSPALAQDCGCSNGGAIFAGGMYAGGDCGGNVGMNNCGRAISHYQAQGLWADYCTESCGFDGGQGGCGSAGRSGCRLGGKFRGLFAGGGFAGGGNACGGCDMGCFGYPTGGCGCNAGGGFAGGGRGGCALGGKLKGMFGGGCGGGCGRQRGGHFGGASGCNSGCGCKLGGKLKGLFAGGLFSKSRSRCGSTGAYFSEAVGYEYGTAGIQSCVSGCGSAAIMGSPMMAAPMGSGCCGATATPVMGNAIQPIADHSHSTDAVDPAVTNIIGEGQPVVEGAENHATTDEH